jgi:hypothetical protein
MAVLPKPQARSDVEVQELPDGCAILDLVSEAVHVLNPSAGFVLALCDGTRTARDIERELASAVPTLAASAVSADVQAALALLSDKGLLQR